jgi:hypothetical protein
LRPALGPSQPKPSLYLWIVEIRRSPLTPTPGLIGWLKPVSRDMLGVFALCWPCAMDGSDDFHARFLKALGGEGALEIPAGRA